MNDNLHLIRQLYGDDADPRDLRAMLDDDELREEYQALSEVKFLLDHRRAVRPDVDVVDRIVGAAGEVPASARGRVDRPARARRAGAVQWWSAVGALLVVLVVVSLGIPQVRSVLVPSAMTETASADRASSFESVAPRFEQNAVAEAEGRGGLQEEGAVMGAEAMDAAAPSGVASDAVAAVTESAEDSLPSWDESDEVFRLHRRVALLEARSAQLNWDEAAIMSLDALPVQGADGVSNLQEASRRQLRVGNR